MFGIIAKFPRWKFGNISSYFRGGNSIGLRLRCIIQNTILNKFSLWEYGNGGTPFSPWKSTRILRLVHYGTPVGFHACVYGVCQHARARTSQCPSKHQAYWCVSHTQRNQCHSGDMDQETHTAMIMHTNSMSMHLQQLPWEHTYITRSRAFMTREGHSKHQAYWCVLHTRRNQCHSGDMDQDIYTVMIIHTILYKYAPIATILGTYLHYKVKSTHD